MSERNAHLRMAFGGVCLFLAMAGVCMRLVFLHFRLEESQQPQKRDVRRTIQADRGNILDCQGTRNVLAMDIVTKDVCADPQALVLSNRVEEVASKLADLLGLSREPLALSLNRPDRRFAYVSRYVAEEVAQMVEKEKMPGVFLQDVIIRNYPHRTFMCHVLGFVNVEGDGSAGIEQTLNRYLKGSPGSIESCVNAKREELYSKRSHYIPPLPGSSVVLTLDQNLQYIAEKALAQAYAEHKARAGWIIMQRVRTGEILAMASLPGYDLNDFRQATDDQKLNRAIGCNYEPGSTMKPLTIAAAINEGLVTPQTPFDCEGGIWIFKNRPLRDAGHRYGVLSVEDILKKSSNIGAAKIGVSLGNRRLYDYLKAFGLGQRLGIELPGEEQGILNPVKQWYDISISRISIGQGVSVTTLQLLGAYCALANGGQLMKPRVIREVRRRDGSLVYESRPEVVSRPVTPRTAEIMCRMLARVTEAGGTGTRAAVEGYSVAGKTGTAQKAVNGAYCDSAHVASFLGFLPADNPEIGIAVVIDEPAATASGTHYASVIAAPTFGVVANQAVRYLDIPPSPCAVASSK